MPSTVWKEVVEFTMLAKCFYFWCYVCLCEVRASVTNRKCSEAYTYSSCTHSCTRFFYSSNSAFGIHKFKLYLLHPEYQCVLFWSISPRSLIKRTARWAMLPFQDLMNILLLLTVALKLLGRTLGTFRTFGAHTRCVHHLLLLLQTASVVTLLLMRCHSATGGARWRQRLWLANTARGGGGGRRRRCCCLLAISCSCGKHCGSLRLQPLDHLQLLHVLGAKYVATQCIAQGVG